MHYVKYLLLFFYSLLTVFLHAFSPPFRNIIARVQDSSKYLDHESTIRSRDLEDLLDSAAPSSTATISLDEMLTPVDPNVPLDLNVLDPQTPQLEPDITSTDVKTDQLSSLENEGNLLQYDDSQNLALLPGDSDGLPIFPPITGGSGEIDIGPNPIQQFMDNLWGHSFNWKTQPKPECKDRSISYGGQGLLHEMFAFCCKGRATYTSNSVANGNEAQRRLSVRERRKDCELWSRSEKCNPDTIDCCFCRREGKVAFYCKEYYTKDGKPGADNDPDPASNKQKREVIPTKESRRDSAATIARSGLVSSRQNNDDMGESEEGIQQDKEANPTPDYVCTADFIKFEGLIPRVRKKIPAQKDQNSEADWETPYEPWTPADELPSDESDLKLPPGWDDNPHNQRPNP